MNGKGFPQPRSPVEEALIDRVERLERALADAVEMLHDRNDTHADVSKLLRRSDALKGVLANES